MATIVARSKGTCSTCKSEYRTGQVIVTTPSGPRHSACPTMTASLQGAVRGELRKRPQGYRF